ncbi:MAG: hypothetical protein COB78_04365 [Hyphomicrobiales bacterium]|nr:MAG: hypothetical protein COB78_04365 [Hyphomicrobiales bacterium]
MSSFSGIVLVKVEVLDIFSKSKDVDIDTTNTKNRIGAASIMNSETVSNRWVPLPRLKNVDSVKVVAKAPAETAIIPCIIYDAVFWITLTSRIASKKSFNISDVI